MTLEIFGETWPLRIDIWRNASIVTQLPMEWARMETSPTAGSRASACSRFSSAVRE